MATGSRKTLGSTLSRVQSSEAQSSVGDSGGVPIFESGEAMGPGNGTFWHRGNSCFESRAKCESKLQEAYQKLAAGLTEIIGVVVINGTFLSPAFQATLQPKLGHHLLIADEVLNVGASKIKTALPNFIQMRLGLSATPERRYDPEGTKPIFDYFGDIAYEFTIADAIKADPLVLCPYFYCPVLMDLTPTEAEKYRELIVQLCRHLSKDDSE